MNPTTLGVIGPGLLNQVPTLGSTGLLSNQGEKSINFYFIRVPLRKKVYTLLFHKGPFKKKVYTLFFS